MLDAMLYALPFLMQGLWVSVEVSVLTVTISLVIGLVLGVGLVYGPLPLRLAVRLLSDTIRGIPILVLIFFVYYGFPAIGIDFAVVLGGGDGADAVQDRAGDRICPRRHPVDPEGARPRRQWPSA